MFLKSFIFILLASCTQAEQSTKPVQKADGKTLYTTKGCVACHSIDGRTMVGPSFKGLLGRQERLTNGQTITIDRDYIIESIKTPNAKIVLGFSPSMPAMPMTPEELQALVDYLVSLK
jgi:cytochrome c oxidase subunit 2